MIGGAWLAIPIDCYAYLDPGTGSLIIQMLFAAFLGAVFYARFYSKKAKEYFADRWNKLKGVQSPSPPDEQDGDEERSG